MGVKQAKGCDAGQGVPRFPAQLRNEHSPHKEKLAKSVLYVNARLVQTPAVN
jgi:hypothetical protein